MLIQCIATLSSASVHKEAKISRAGHLLAIRSFSLTAPRISAVVFMRMQSTVRDPASSPPHPAEEDTSYQAEAASSGVPASAPTAPLATPDSTT